jgi:hypothetical protein
MDILTIEQYGEAERAGAERSCNRIIQCCAPTLFLHYAYPTTVASMTGLRRYVDVMHEGRVAATFRDYLEGITEHEFELLYRVTRAVAELAEARYGRRLVATASLLRALHLVRQIRFLHPEPNVTIFEIGHGSGFVGALLIAAGYGYASTDITEGFYVYQNHLMNALAPGRVIELATDPRPLSDLAGLEPGTALHVPWWKFMVAAPEGPFTCEVVTCNHALAEMHVNALSYSLAFGRRMLAPRDGAFVFEGWGATEFCPIWAVAKRFADLDYVIAHNNMPVSVFVPANTANAKGALRLPLPWRKDVVRHANAYPQQAFIETFHPPIYITDNNPLSALITAGREAIKPRYNKTLGDVEAMWRQVLGRDDLASDDERFLHVVGSGPI